jgi:hypothetical protein
MQPGVDHQAPGAPKLERVAPQQLERLFVEPEVMTERLGIQRPLKATMVILRRNSGTAFSSLMPVSKWCPGMPSCASSAARPKVETGLGSVTGIAKMPGRPSSVGE